MTHSDTEVVSALRRALAEQLGQQRFDMWLGRDAGLALEGDTLVVTAPNALFQGWLRTKLREEIERAGMAVMGRRPTVVFQVHPASAGSGNGSDCPDDPDGPGRDNRPDCDGRPTPEDRPNHDDCPEAAESASRRSWMRFADLASFVVGPSNRLARAAAEMVAERPGELSPLVIYGATSVGKTHLLQAIWTAARQRRRAAVIYLTAEQFTTAFVQALRGGGLPSFRQKHRGVDLLLVDDLQFFCGKQSTQVELLYTVDALLRGGKQVVFAADRSPGELPGLGRDLAARLQSGLICRIDRADFEMRLGILAQMARRMGLEVPLEVRQFIAARLTNHARELSGALCRLQAASRALDKPIDLRLAEETLAEMILHSRRALRLADVEEAVCKAFDLDATTLHAGGRTKRASHPRMLAMWLARKHTRAALSEIGEFFGRRSHATVVSAQKRVDRWLAEGATLDLAGRSWSIEEAIEHLERCLQAG